MLSFTSNYARMTSSYTSSPRPYDYDDIDSLDFDDEKYLYGNASDEDTEDASETDIAKQEEYTEIKEQMYQDKLAHLKKQLAQLKDGSLPEYIKRRKKIEYVYKDRLRMNETWRDFELQVVERDFIKEKKAAGVDFEDKKIDLKENLIAELEEKKRQLEGERGTMELTGDSMDVKPVITRKLRRRPNEPIPLPEKRRKPSPDLNYVLDESDIMEDLRIINKVSGKPINRKPTPVVSPVDPISDVKIDDGKLYYDKRWFHRGQPVFVESKEAGKVAGVILVIGTQEIMIRKIVDGSKLKIYLSQLMKGKYLIRRRTT